MVAVKTVLVLVVAAVVVVTAVVVHCDAPFLVRFLSIRWLMLGRIGVQITYGLILFVLHFGVVVVVAARRMPTAMGSNDPVIDERFSEYRLNQFRKVSKNSACRQGYSHSQELKLSFPFTTPFRFEPGKECFGRFHTDRHHP